MADVDGGVVANSEQTPDGAKEWHEQENNIHANRYLTFISIIFGVFISVWIQPIVEIFPPPKSENAVDIYLEIKIIFGELYTERVLRGAVMFVMLVCLWWWYGMFLGRIAPARSFWPYLYDFVSLSAFAVAFRMWGHPLIFPMIVFFAAALMLGRFLGAKRYVKSGTVQYRALNSALAALKLFMLVAFGAIILVIVTDVKEFLNSYWVLVQRATMLLLLFGIGATFRAVYFIDKLPFPTKWPLMNLFFKK